MIGMFWIRFRNYLYDNDFLTIAKSQSSVLSVGNLSWGGTGKTSLTAEIAAFLTSRGYRVAIVSRGYGRKSKGLRLVSDGSKTVANWTKVGDEPYLLSQRVPEALILVSEDRSKALQFLNDHEPDVILLDDAFQHRKVARDLDIVLVDASENLLKQKVIPFGKLREPLDSLQRAGALVLTHSRSADPVTLDWIRDNIEVPVFHADYVPVDTSEIQGRTVAAFCGIGSPGQFFKMVSEHGATVVLRKEFRDHVLYSEKDIAKLQAEASTVGAVALVTTQKDGIKIPIEWLRMPVIVIEARLKLEEDTFFSFVCERLPKCATS